MSTKHENDEQNSRGFLIIQKVDVCPRNHESLREVLQLRFSVRGLPDSEQQQSSQEGQPRLGEIWSLGKTVQHIGWNERICIGPINIDQPIINITMVQLSSDGSHITLARGLSSPMIYHEGVPTVELTPMTQSPPIQVRFRYVKQLASDVRPQSKNPTRQLPTPPNHPPSPRSRSILRSPLSTTLYVPLSSISDEKKSHGQKSLR